jgi:hypothetical protein
LRLALAPGLLALQFGIAGPDVVIGAHVVHAFIGSAIYAIPAR